MPKYIVLPSERSKRLSNRLKMFDRGWWMVVMTVRPFWHRCRNESITFKALNESTARVGGGWRLHNDDRKKKRTIERVRKCRIFPEAKKEKR